jgi:hypothetical protein
MTWWELGMNHVWDAPAVKTKKERGRNAGSK